MSVLPTGWREVALVDLGADVPHAMAIGPFGSDLKTSDYTDSGVPVVFVRHVRENRFELSDCRFVSQAKADSLRAHRLTAGDLAITKMGLPPGVAAVYPEGEPDGIVTADIIKMTPDTRRVHAGYLSRAINSVVGRSQISQFTFGQTRPKVTLRDFRALKIPLPPLAEQKRIAAILDKADEIRRKRVEALTLTEELLRSAFLEMVGPAAPGYARWPEVTLAELASKGNGGMRTGPFGSDLRHSEFVDSGVAVLGIDNAVQNRFAWGERRFITTEKYKKLLRYTVHPGDVIVTIMGTTGRSAVVPEDIPLAITTKHLATISLDRSMAEAEFVAQALHRHPAVLRQIESAHRGAIMNGLNLGLIKALVVRLPPLDMQKRFSAFTSSVRGIGARFAVGNEARLAAALTQRAFSGRL